METPSPYAIQVLERADALLSALAQRSEAVNLKTLAAETGLHPSTCHRILNDLLVARIVERAGVGEYKLGMRLLELGNLVKARLSIRDVALEPMRRLHRTTGQTVNLSVRQGDEIVYIERAYSERSGMQVVRAIGGRAPLHLTSVGKLFLADFDEKNLKNYISRTQLKAQTVNSITQPAALNKILGQIRSQGVSFDDEELELGVRCVAAGVYDDNGKLIAGLSLSCPAERMQESWGGQIRDTAQAISNALGFIK